MIGHVFCFMLIDKNEDDLFILAQLYGLNNFNVIDVIDIQGYYPQDANAQRLPANFDLLNKVQGTFQMTHTCLSKKSIEHQAILKRRHGYFEDYFF